MRFLLFVCILCSTFVVTTLYASAAPHQGCVQSTPVAQPVIPSPQPKLLVINEVLLFPGHSWDCSGSVSLPNKIGDWLELYNPQNQAFDLYAAHTMIDSGPNTNSMLLPFGTSIAPHGFLVVFPSSNTPTFHNTETYWRRLLMNDVVLDQVPLPMLGTDQSYARIPDGAPDWQVTTTPTIGSSNDQASVLPTPSITPTPTHPPKHHSTKGSATGGTNQRTTRNHASNTTDTTTNDPAGPPATADGTQPAWSNLQLPPGSSSSPEATTSANTSSDSTTATSPPSTADNADLPRKVLFTSLAIVLVGVLLLYLRRFKPT